MPNFPRAIRFPLFALCFAGFLSVASAQTVGTQTIYVGSAAGGSTVLLAYAPAWTATANDSFLHLSQVAPQASATR